MGTEFLIIILLWCGQGLNTYDHTIMKCRKRAIECVRKLKNFTTDDVIDKCLQPDGAK